MAEIDDTLRELDRWYNDLPGGTERPQLLAKLATLELCGWIEYRLDVLVRAAGMEVGLDEEWVNSNVVKDNFGFTYRDHLRRMLARLIGEFAVLHLEQTFEEHSPGTLDQLKGALGTLRKNRDVLAHTYSANPVVRQQAALNAPSWAINQHRIIAKMLDQLQDTFGVAFARTIADTLPR